jgi:hypothetical protein
MHKPSIRTILLVAGFILISLLLVYWRIPHDPAAPPQVAKTAFILSAFMFLVSMPCFYLVFKIVFGRFVGLLFSVFFALLALFPYKLFYGPEVNLVNICFYPVPKTVFGASGIWVLIFYFAVALAVVSFYWLKKTGKFFPAVDRNRILIFTVFFLAAVIQIVPRLGENSPKSVRRGLHRENAPNPYRTLKFYGVETGGYDVWHHVGPSGIFKGSFEIAKTVVINRRGFAPYLYSLVSIYFHPYYGAIFLNGFFYYIILVTGYLLAKQLRLNESVAVAYALLLSANCFILSFVLEPTFYVQYFAFIILILLLIYKLGIFQRQPPLANQLLFCFVLASSALTYDAFVFSGIVLLWGLFVAVKTLSKGFKSSLAILAHTLGLGLVPIVSQYVWEVLLRLYNLEGVPDNLQVRAGLFDRLFSLPKFVCSDFRQFLILTGKNIFTIVVENPILPASRLLARSLDAAHTALTGETSIEYWMVLGLLGVISFFVLLPRYINKEHRSGLYACYLSNFSIALISSLAAAVPPLMKYHWIFLSPSRTNNAYPVLVLAQSIAIFYLVGWCCRKLKAEEKTGAFVIAVAVCIYLLSFAELLFP